MTEQEILAGLAEIVEEIAGVPADDVHPEKSFVDDLDIDSLSMVEIAVAAEDKFGVKIPDDELQEPQDRAATPSTTSRARTPPPECRGRNRSSVTA